MALTKLTKPRARWATFKSKLAGAVQRILLDKIQEFISVKDFGAVGDGVTDDTVAVRAALSLGGKVFVPEGTYRITERIVINKSGCIIIGEGQNFTKFVTDIDDLLFEVQYHTKMRDLQIQNTYTSKRGIAVGTPINTDSNSAQAVYCDFENVYINGFFHGWWFRASIWCSWKNCHTRNLCGIRFARHKDPYDRTNPSAPASWNAYSPSLGWFHNVGTIEQCNFEDDEVGIWGSCMSYTIDSCTTQRQRTAISDTRCIPVGEPATGLWLESGTDGTRNAWGNSITQHYAEATHRPFRFDGQREVILDGGFIQGGTSGARYDTPVEANYSTVNIKGLTGQDWFTWILRMSKGATVYGDIPGATSGSPVEKDDDCMWYRNADQSRYTHRYTVSVSTGAPERKWTIPINMGGSYAVYEISVAGLRDGYAAHMQKWQVFRYSDSIKQVDLLTTTEDTNLKLDFDGSKVVLEWGNASQSFSGHITVEEVSNRRYSSIALVGHV